MPKILIGPGVLRNSPGAFRDVLVQAGFELIEPAGGDILSREILRETLPFVDAQLCGGEIMNAEMIELARNLRVIARVGVGYDAVDVEAATRSGVAVTITPGTNHGSVAEHVFGLLLSLTRNVIEQTNIIRADSWKREIIRPIRGQTLGLVGLGRIGKAVATRALAFEMNVIAYDSFPDHDFAALHGIEFVSMDDLLARSDVVSLHMPCTAENRRMCNRDFFAKMKPGAILINTARGGVIDEDALVEALKSGHLAGAGLDVFEIEPLPQGHPLRFLPNVAMTSHTAGVDSKSLSDMAELAARCVADLHEGRWPAPCIVNNAELADRGWSWRRHA